MVSRVVSFLGGVALLALGIALSLRAGLGTSPISTLPAVLAAATPLSVGAYTILMNLGFVVLQVLLLRGRFPRSQYAQVLVALAFGGFVDLAMAATAWIAPTGYAAQWAWTLLGIVVSGTGIFFQVRPRLTTTPGEGVVGALAQVTGRPFSTMKIAFDSTMVAVSIVLGLVLLGRLEGVREGTLAAAVLVGTVVGLWGRVLPPRGTRDGRAGTDPDRPRGDPDA